MKTILEWLEQLPEPYRGEALENYHKSNWLRNDQSSLDMAFLHAFDWAESPQGHSYWSDLRNKFLRGSIKLQQIEDLFTKYKDYGVSVL